MITNEHNSMPYMKSLANCLNQMLKEGYTENFKITEQGLQSQERTNNYSADQVEIVNFFRFEGESDPDDNAILYVIETNDGAKGTLIDAYGIYNDQRISSFMKNVDTIQKKSVKN